MVGWKIVLVALVLLSRATLASAQRVGDDVRATIQRSGEARVLVGLAAGATGSEPLSGRRIATATLQRRVLRTLAPGDFRVVHKFQAVPALAGSVSARGLSILLANPDVERVVLDTGGMGGLATTVPLIHADVLHNTYGLTGAGVSVGVIDTGIDSNHPDLASSLVGEQCFCSTHGGCCPNGQTSQSGAGAAEDDNSHGSHVSGIITSDGNVASVGVAPAANIVAVKVIAADNTFCCISDVIAGMDWIANNRPDVKVVNMSLGTFATYPDPCDSLDINPFVATAVNNLRANGVTVFVASMNNGDASHIASPACLSNSVAVGATDNSDVVASFSNSSPALDLLGPGVGVVSSVSGGGVAAFSGTSMATPHAAGTAALLLEARPSASPDDIEAALEEGGVSVTDPRNSLVRPRVDALGALLSLKCGNGMVDPGEGCDDGNLVDGDGCDNNCTPTGCGNGVVTAGEQCDEGANNGAGPVPCCTVSCGLIDLDGDGVCDRDDACPHVVSAPGNLIPPIRSILNYKGTGPGGNDDVVKLASAVFSHPVAFDPTVADSFHLRLRNTRTEGTLFAVDLGAGTGSQWSRPRPTRERWVWTDRTRPHPMGVKRVVVKGLGSHLYRFDLVGGDGNISAANAPLVVATDDVEVLLEIEANGIGACYTATLDACERLSPRKDRCRW